AFAVLSGIALKFAYDSWTASGDAARALEGLKQAFTDVGEIGKSAFQGIVDAIATGDTPLAPEILKAGVTDAFKVIAAEVKEIWANMLDDLIKGTIKAALTLGRKEIDRKDIVNDALSTGAFSGIAPTAPEEPESESAISPRLQE